MPSRRVRLRRAAARGGSLLGEPKAAPETGFDDAFVRDPAGHPLEVIRKT